MTAAQKWKKKLSAIRGRTVIGLTGPIASGKSLALNYFRKEGAYVISTDAVTAGLLTTPGIYHTILRKFKPETILKNGSLDKGKLAAEVFSSPAKRKWLEGLLHPEILKITYSLITKSPKKIVVVEAPLLFEAELAGCFTFTVCLSVPEKVLRERALKRGWTLAQYAARVRAQLPAAEKYARADLVLDNSGPARELGRKIRFICRFFTEAA